MNKHIITTLDEYLNEKVLNKILYHGSYTDGLTRLEPYSNLRNNIPPSIFLSSKKSVAKDYGDYIYLCKIDVNNIKTIDVNGESFHNFLSFERDIINAYDDEYDCIIFKNIMDSKEPDNIVPLSDIYVIFDINKVNILDKI